LNRLAALACYYLKGSLDFKILILFGNLSLICIFIILYISFEREKREKPLLFIPVALLYFQPQYAEATQWATATSSFFLVYVFALLTLMLFNRHTPAIHLLMIFLSLCATFTYGNGVFVPMVISILLFLTKRWKEAIFWAFAAVVFVFGFQFRSISDALFSPGPMAGTWKILDYFFTFVGSGLAFSNHTPALLTGIALTLYFFFLLGVKYYRRNPVFFGFYLFLLLSAFANTLSRISLGFSPYLTSRYSFITVLLLIGVYLSLIECLKNRKLFYAVCVFSVLFAILFSAISYLLNFNQYRVRHQLLHDSMLCWQVNREGLPYPDGNRAKDILERAVKTGVFKPPSIKVSDYYSKRIPLNDISYKKERIINRVDSYIETSELILVRGWAFLYDEDSHDVKIYLILDSPYVRYIYTTISRVRPDVTTHHKIHLNQGFLDHSGFTGLIKKADLIEGNYDLGVVLVKNKSAAIQLLNFSVKIK